MAVVVLGTGEGEPNIENIWVEFWRSQRPARVVELLLMIIQMWRFW